MSIFEDTKQVNEHGSEYWSARILARVLDYSDFRNFQTAIDKAMDACVNSGYEISDHFSETTTTFKMAKGALRELTDYHLSRYACYLIVQNADPSKEYVALGQTYFAVQTRKQELAEEFPKLSEDERRLQLRKEMKIHNTKLADAAKNAGVKEAVDYAIFQNHGYKGLYGGMDAKDIKLHKGLKKSQQILDYMGSTELAANLFRATQTEDKLRREKITGKDNANRTHFQVGQKVRQTISELGGTMPENLPVPEKSIQQIEKTCSTQVVKNKN